MARNLTNKQLEIVVDEIFDKVSQPIIDKNKKQLEAVELPKFQYFKDAEACKKISEKIEVLEKLKTSLKDKYYRKEYEGFKFGWVPFSEISDFENFKKKELTTTTEYPSRDVIERQVILAGNSDIPKLIEELINKLSK